MSTASDYILSFLLYNQESLFQQVGYTVNPKHFKRYKVVIVPSSFFNEEVYGTLASEPSLPLQEIEGVPLLYGENRVERIEQTIVVYADIVASSYFLISRYEEYLHPDDYRDSYGRFIGNSSLPARAGFMSRPIIEEYAALLRGWLRMAGVDIDAPKPGFSDVLLTHDVDVIGHYRSFRGALGGIKRMFNRNSASPFALVRSWNALQKDPAYTFPWLIEEDKLVAQAHTIFFVKSGVTNAPLDRPFYSLRSKDFKEFMKLCDLNHCHIGLHSSYAAGSEPKRIKKELKRLQKQSHVVIRRNRNHYLRALQPLDMRLLIKYHITDDFTMGYADLAGFRLGTCRPVRWIDPEKQKVTDLTLHPLTAMDATLTRADYMNMTQEQAFAYVKELIDITKRYHGEVVLLWHNTSVQENDPNNSRNLYHALIEHIKE